MKTLYVLVLLFTQPTIDGSKTINQPVGVYGDIWDCYYAEKTLEAASKDKLKFECVSKKVKK